MKLLVFAHTPPPYHGQSFMVQSMLEGFGGDCAKQRNSPSSPYNIQCYHVNARVSKHLEDIGELRFSKLLLLIWYCMKAIWCGWRHDVPNFYYVPAPGKRSALYRDWLVMALCRPFFKRIILHWHASGLGKWMETVQQVRTRAITFRLIGKPDLSIVLAESNKADAAKLWSHRIKVVGNGIKDPCTDFYSSVLPRRLARLQARRRLCDGHAVEGEQAESAGGGTEVFRVLFLAHCMHEKGLFDCIEAVALANKTLREQGALVRLELDVAGEFISPEEKNQFEQRIAGPDLRSSTKEQTSIVTYHGFVLGAAKKQLFLQNDCFCFPTYYSAESFGLVVVEAMAFGLPVVATRWRSLPELLPRDYPGLVRPNDPESTCRALISMMSEDLFVKLRSHFMKEFLMERHLHNLAHALCSVEGPLEDDDSNQSQDEIPRVFAVSR